VKKKRTIKFSNQLCMSNSISLENDTQLPT
jgi:hypothetical protein